MDSTNHREEVSPQMRQILTSTYVSRRLAFFSSTLLLGGAMALAQTPGGGGAGQMQQQQPQQQQQSQQQQQMGQAQAQQGDPTGGMQDKAFVHEALQGGMAEVQLGQLAAEKGSSPDVKQFGQKMADDHTKLGDQMKQVADQVGVKPPKDISKKDKELLSKLQGLSGAQFDNAYITAMVKDHKKDLDAFKSEAQQGQTPAVQQAAQQGGQIIAQHLQMIQQIAQSHNLMDSKGKLTSSGS
jgi:putative membrane protein